ncbi:MAG: hypothetical protein COA52_02325 [Hyphomicrobiales bacterium]|nr:MAG: hypothetical protein COA52_02325 [Hyphomicrobiales bacterium]
MRKNTALNDEIAGLKDQLAAASDAANAMQTSAGAAIAEVSELKSTLTKRDNLIKLLQARLN